MDQPTLKLWRTASGPAAWRIRLARQKKARRKLLNDQMYRPKWAWHLCRISENTMRLLVDGVWHDQRYDTKSTGGLFVLRPDNEPGFAMNIAFTRKNAFAQIGVVRCDTPRPSNERGNVSSFAFRHQADRNSFRISVVSVGFSSGKKCPPFMACPCTFSAHFRQIPSEPPSCS